MTDTQPKIFISKEILNDRSEAIENTVIIPYLYDNENNKKEIIDAIANGNSLPEHTRIGTIVGISLNGHGEVVYKVSIATVDDKDVPNEPRIRTLHPKNILKLKNIRTSAQGTQC